MSFGRYREIGTLQRKVETSDSSGGLITTWTNVGTFYFQVEPQTRTLELIDSKIDAPHQAIWRTWYREDFDGDKKLSRLYRILYDGLQWNIHSVRDLDRRRRELELIVYTLPGEYEVSEGINNAFPYTFPFELS